MADPHPLPTLKRRGLFTVIPSSLRLLTALFAAIQVSAAFAGDRQVTFIHLNDLHANLTPHTDLVRTTTSNGQPAANIETRGGLARIATLVRQVREENPGTTVRLGRA